MMVKASLKKDSHYPLTLTRHSQKGTTTTQEDLQSLSQTVSNELHYTTVINVLPSLLKKNKQGIRNALHKIKDTFAQGQKLS